MEVLKSAQLVAFPTDTFYGIAADPCCPRAVRRLLSLKGRTATLPLIASDLAQVRQVAALTGMAARLAGKFWPGPFTLILPATGSSLAAGAMHGGTVAIRIPRQRIARALARQFGGPVTATSANRTGQPPARSALEVSRSLPHGLALILDAGRSRAVRPSTIVRVRRGRVEIIRDGAVSQRRIRSFVDRGPAGW